MNWDAGLDMGLYMIPPEVRRPSLTVVNKEVEWVDVDQIQVCHLVDQDQLKCSDRRACKLKPITLLQHPSGKFLLADGHHRLGIWKRKGFCFVPAVILDCDEDADLIQDNGKTGWMLKKFKSKEYDFFSLLLKYEYAAADSGCLAF